MSPAPAAPKRPISRRYGLSPPPSTASTASTPPRRSWKPTSRSCSIPAPRTSRSSTTSASSARSRSPRPASAWRTGLIAGFEDLYVTPAARGLRHGRRLPREQRGLVPRPRLQPPRDRHRWRPRTATPAQLLSPGRVSPTRASCSASHYKDRPAHTDQAVRPRSRKAHTSRTTIERTPPARSPRLSIRRDVRLPDTHGATASDGVNSRSTGHEEGPGFPDASGRRVIG